MAGMMSFTEFSKSLESRDSIVPILLLDKHSADDISSVAVTPVGPIPPTHLKPRFFQQSPWDQVGEVDI